MTQPTDKGSMSEYLIKYRVDLYSSSRDKIIIKQPFSAMVMGRSAKEAWEKVKITSRPTINHFVELLSVKKI